MKGIQQIKEYIIANGGQVNQLPFGRIYIKWNSKDVRDKRFTCIVRFNGKGFIGNCFEAIIPSIIKYNLINLEEFSCKKCGKCGGKGIIDYYRYNDSGICFKCGGIGIVE